MARHSPTTRRMEGHGKPARSGCARRYIRRVQLVFRRAFRQNSSPAKTALGLAVGSFIGIFPSFLLGTPIAFLVAGWLGLNRAAAVAGTFLTNPVTAPVYYSASTWIGLHLLGKDLGQVELQGLASFIQHVGWPFLVGNTLFAAAFAASLGVLAFFFARSLKRRRDPRGAVGVQSLEAPEKVKKKPPVARAETVPGI